MKKIGILGASGKMGTTLLSLPSPRFQLIPLCRQKQHLTQDPFSELEALIDFSHVDTLHENLQKALERRLPLVIGITGHTPHTWEQMEKASLTIPILYSPNFSIGIALIKKFIALHAPLLEKSYIDIFETHHTTKKDLPSGTALDLARMFPHKEINLSSSHPRSQDDLVIHAQRVPGHPGAHTIEFTFPEETLSFHHHAQRAAYAQGALMATEFLLGKKPGFYSFADVFST